MLPHGRGHCISSVSSLPLTRGRVNLQRVPATLARFPGVDARSLTWRKLPQHLLRDRRPADCVERRPHSGGSADPHAGAEGREGWAFTCPLPIPHPGHCPRPLWEEEKLWPQSSQRRGQVSGLLSRQLQLLQSHGWGMSLPLEEGPGPPPWPPSLFPTPLCTHFVAGPHL